MCKSLCGVLTLGSADMFSEVVQLGYMVGLPVVSLGSSVLMFAAAVGAYILTRRVRLPFHCIVA